MESNVVAFKTVEELLRKYIPEVAKKLDKEGMWDCRIISPAGFDDAAMLTIMVRWNKDFKWTTYRLVITRCIAVEEVKE